MSGGRFNYDQYRIDQIANEIDDLIFHNGSNELDEYGELKHQNYPPDIIETFKEAANTLRKAYVYAQRIDWLVCGDDSDDSFRKRLESDIEQLKPYMREPDQ